MSEAVRYTGWGVALGFCFPVGSIVFLHLTGEFVQEYNLAGFTGGIVRMHRENPLLFVIDSAPFWLGLSAYLAGKRQDQIRYLASGLEREVLAKTESLRQALVEEQRANETIIYLAEHDALTGLLNRSRFERELTR